ncbi:rCG55719 [Rattus norvegicus]|uniref:RCG55719 n=1 Tax=Rattus norvegicus TaxID=10116 RepID=A6JLN3_RAT|nr:rCG55719 [Rattus norvegicus]
MHQIPHSGPGHLEGEEALRCGSG